MGKNVKRLFSNFRPKHYVLDLRPDREKKTFSGTVTITGQKTGKPSQRLSFHQSKLTISSATMTRHDKKAEKEIIVDRINNHDNYDEVRLHAKEMLYPGSYTVRLTFSGKITRQMNGIYPCLFKQDKQEKQLIATQFESHHAREVFPCIDEPEAKAIFELTLVHPADETVLSNTPIASQRKVSSLQSPVSSKDKAVATGDKRLATTFEPTPHMSTYLLAFVYGELGHLESKTKNGTVVRTFATEGNVKFTEFALDVAVKCLEFYEDYFAIPYPLAKADMVALPDFASGAMENWGLITYREHALLVDPDNSTLGTKQYVAMVVAHELAHQWFGNLVTMRWWTDLWLNEGFASWIEYLAVDHLFPQWEMWTQFVVDEQQQALKLDALEHTHPIEAPIGHPDEIRTIFDAISYSKGSSVIHMLHEYLGPEAFKGGLRHYLKLHAYGNTDTVDLWKALEEISGKPVKSFMHEWTSSPGFPLLRADVSTDHVQLQQERFFLNPRHSPVSQDEWPIPLLAGKDMPADLLAMRQMDIKIPEPGSLKFNLGQSGFYRTAYNSSHLEELGFQIKKGHLPPLDRLGILSDLFENAKAGHANTIDGLHFLENFVAEDNYAVWDIIASALGSIRMVLDSEEMRDDMKPYTLNLIGAQLKRLGWDRKENESHFDRLLRPIILGLAAVCDEPSIVNRCQKLFASIDEVNDVPSDHRVTPSGSQIKRGIDIDPDLRGTVFGTVARLGGEKEFNKMLRLHNASTLSEERTTLVAALTGFKQSELIERALGLIDGKDVRLQDVSYWIAYSFMNRHGKRQTWEWLKDHWKWLEENLGSDLSFYRMPIYAARVFSSEDFAKDYTKFFKPKITPALERSYNQGLEMLTWHAAWKARDMKEIAHFFKARLTQ